VAIHIGLTGKSQYGASVGSSLHLAGYAGITFLYRFGSRLRCALCAVYPFVAILRSPARRRRYRRKHGLCLNCGYSLTGLTENRCPECATEFEQS